MESFKVSEAYLKEFLKYAEDKGVKFTNEELAKSGGELKSMLKGLIVRNLYGLDYYIRYDNITDKEVQRALMKLSDKDL